MNTQLSQNSKLNENQSFTLTRRRRKRELLRGLAGQEDWPRVSDSRQMTPAPHSGFLRGALPRTQGPQGSLLHYVFTDTSAVPPTQGDQKGNLVRGAWEARPEGIQSPAKGPSWTGHSVQSGVAASLSPRHRRSSAMRW